jgi:hypothetical protein
MNYVMQAEIGLKLWSTPFDCEVHAKYVSSQPCFPLRLRGIVFSRHVESTESAESMKCPKANKAEQNLDSKSCF